MKQVHVCVNEVLKSRSTIETLHITSHFSMHKSAVSCVVYTTLCHHHQAWAQCGKAKAKSPQLKLPQTLPECPTL